MIARTPRALGSSLNSTSTTKKAPLAPSDRIAYALATGFGVGFLPFAPGTAGSLEGVAIYFAIVALNLGDTSSLIALVVITVILLCAGVWASSRVCEVTGLADVQSIVIDEITGQLITLLPLAILSSLSIKGVIIGFGLFRIFDIFKPYPIGRLEKLHGGLGVMADDALAGVYGALLLWGCVLAGVA